MQEQKHSDEEERLAASSIHAFQEVVYPPPLWRRIAFILLRIILGFIFGLITMYLAVAAGLRDLVFAVLLTASIPGIIHPKTRFFCLGLLLALMLLRVVVFSF